MFQRLRRQISLEYYTIPPATQANESNSIFTLLTCIYRPLDSGFHSMNSRFLEVVEFVGGIPDALRSIPDSNVKQI